MKEEDLIILLKDLQSLPKECEWVEFKQNNSLPQSIGENLSALSNSACYNNQRYGYLVYGIENETHRLVGTNFFPKNEKIGNEELENWISSQIRPKVDFNIFNFYFLELHFVIFRVEATISIPVTFKGVSFIRIGSYTKKLSEHPEKESKIWNKKDKVVFERLIAIKNQTEDDVFKLLDTNTLFSLLQLKKSSNEELIIEKLVELRLIIKSGKKFDITNLGAILFAEKISTFETINRKTIRAITYKGNNRVVTKTEREGIKGYAVGFEGLNNYILNNIPSTEYIENGIRKSKYLFPPLAIRELVANALIHQDFSISGTSPLIEIFDNRIEITNPGKPLIDTLRFVDHSPESRNELLAKTMRLLRICEERGSGIDKVIFECELNEMPVPKFIVGDNFTRIILPAPKPFKEMEKDEKIRACYLHACLKSESGEFMTNQSLRRRFGIEEKNYSIISRIIAEAKDENLVKDYDPENKSRTYAKYLPFWA